MRDEQYVDCKKKKKKIERILLTGFTHEKEETFYTCQVNIYTIIDFFCLFLVFEDETDSMLVLLTRYCMR